MTEVLKLQNDDPKPDETPEEDLPSSAFSLGCVID